MDAFWRSRSTRNREWMHSASTPKTIKGRPWRTWVDYFRIDWEETMWPDKDSDWKETYTVHGTFATHSSGSNHEWISQAWDAIKKRMWLETNAQLNEKLSLQRDGT